MKQRSHRGGFTLVEVMVALTVLAIGVTGILKLTVVAFKATNVSRHTTEASVLAEDKMEALRTIPTAILSGNNDTVKDEGVAGSGTANSMVYTRTWTVTTVGVNVFVTVRVDWTEDGTDAYFIKMTTQRTL
jgi:type IV pilus assembly protein PilV